MNQTNTSQTTKPRKRRGRAAIGLSPRDLPRLILDLAGTLARNSGRGAAYLYGRFDLDQFNVNPGTWRKHVKKLRRSGGTTARGSLAGRIDVVADAIFEYLHRQDFARGHAKVILARVASLYGISGTAREGEPQ